MRRRPPGYIRGPASCSEPGSFICWRIVRAGAGSWPSAYCDEAETGLRSLPAVTLQGVFLTQSEEPRTERATWSTVPPPIPGLSPIRFGQRVWFSGTCHRQADSLGWFVLSVCRGALPLLSPRLCAWTGRVCHCRGAEEEAPRGPRQGGETRKDPESAITDGYDGERWMDSWRCVRKSGLRLGHPPSPTPVGCQNHIRVRAATHRP